MLMYNKNFIYYVQVTSSTPVLNGSSFKTLLFSHDLIECVAVSRFLIRGRKICKLSHPKRPVFFVCITKSSTTGTPVKHLWFSRLHYCGKNLI